MAAAAAIAPSALITRSSSSSSSSSSSYIHTSKRFLSSSFSINKPILRPSLHLSHSLQPFSAARIRRRLNQSGSDSGDLALFSKLFPGFDNKHWLIDLDRELFQGANKQQIIDVFVQTLAWALGSEKEAKKKIYKILYSRPCEFKFGCEIDEDTADRLLGLPGVLFVLPDCYVDPENKDYGGELYVNGEIVNRSPERQMRVKPLPRTAQDIPSDDEPDSLCHKNSN